MGESISGQPGYGLARVADYTPTNAETAATAVAAQARAGVESRYFMALRKPRNELDARNRLMEACQRPTFAETGRYAKPIGQEFVRGFSIRFAEEAARCWTNVLVESVITFDDDKKRLIRVTATDLENNLSWPMEMILAKTVERKFLKKGQTALATRTNARGENVNIVEATDDDMLTKTNAAISKAARTAILRLIPGDVLDDAERQILETMATQDKKDPAAAAKRLSTEFFGLGIMAVEVEEYIGQQLDHLTPANLAWLRSVLHTVKDGDATWAEIVAAGPPGGRPATPAAARSDAAPAEGASAPAVEPSRTDALRERIQQRTARGAAKISEASTATLLDLVAHPCFTGTERAKVEDSLQKGLSELRAGAWITDLQETINKRRNGATQATRMEWDRIAEEQLDLHSSP